MDGYGEISEQGFGTHGRNRDARLLVFVLAALSLQQRIVDHAQLPLFFLLSHLQIRDRRLQLRIPIDQSLVAVDQPLIVQSEKSSPYGARKSFVHGKARPLPIARTRPSVAAVARSCCRTALSTAKCEPRILRAKDFWAQPLALSSVWKLKAGLLCPHGRCGQP